MGNQQDQISKRINLTTPSYKLALSYKQINYFVHLHSDDTVDLFQIFK